MKLISVVVLIIYFTTQNEYASAFQSPKGTHIQRPIPSTKLNLQNQPSIQQKTSFLQNLDNFYTQSSATIRCPFIKRRIADTIDNFYLLSNFLIIRHKSLLALFGMDVTDVGFIEVPGCKAVGRHFSLDEFGNSVKMPNLPLTELQAIIQEDWDKEKNKGYYVTGKLNSKIYRNDCFFDGPDPDMPVRGLRKYLNAASNLFDSKHSFATMNDIEVVALSKKEQENRMRICLDTRNDDDCATMNQDYNQYAIQVNWKMEGVLMLPWRPKVKPLTGWTRYYLDNNGLICYHQEGWDVSVMEAFIGTILPSVHEKVWGNTVENDSSATISEQ